MIFNDLVSKFRGLTGGLYKMSMNLTYLHKLTGYDQHLNNAYVFVS